MDLNPRFPRRAGLYPRSSRSVDNENRSENTEKGLVILTTERINLDPLLREPFPTSNFSRILVGEEGVTSHTNKEEDLDPRRLNSRKKLYRMGNCGRHEWKQMSCLNKEDSDPVPCRLFSWRATRQNRSAIRLVRRRFPRRTKVSGSESRSIARTVFGATKV